MNTADTLQSIEQRLHRVQEALALSKSSTTTPGACQQEPQERCHFEQLTTVNKVFTTLKLLYPAWFEKHYGLSETRVMAKRIWHHVLEDISPKQVDRGLQRMAKECDFPPTPSAFLTLCQRIDGLPTPTHAWIEALQGRYSHDAVRIAAKATGTFDLRQAKTDDKALQARFERNYAIVVRRLENGEPLEAAIAMGIGFDTQAQRQDEYQKKVIQEQMAKQGILMSGKEARKMVLKQVGLWKKSHPNE